MIELAAQHKTGLVLTTPLLTMAGTWGFADEYAKQFDFSRLGAFVTNPLTWNPRQPARANGAVNTSAGVVLHTGLPNPGVRNALKRFGGKWQRLACPVIPHLALDQPDQAWRAVELLAEHRNVIGVELGFRHDSNSADAAAIIEAAVDGELPVIVRLPHAEFSQLAQVAARSGAIGLTCCAPPRYVATEPDAAVLPSGRIYSPTHIVHNLAAVQLLQAQTDLSLLVAGVSQEGHLSEAGAAGAKAAQIGAGVWQSPQAVQALFDAV